MSDFDPLDLEANQAIEAERRQKQGNRARVIRDDWTWLMGSKRGRRIVWGILEECGVFRTSFTGNSETFFREGRRAIGLWALDLAAANPDIFAQMMAEAKE
jgi:hypothetical protein